MMKGVKFFIEMVNLKWSPSFFKTITNNLDGQLGKKHIKKSVFFSGRTTKDLTPPPNGLVVHVTFYNSQKRILTKKIILKFLG